jgi:hypothetical protein
MKALNDLEKSFKGDLQKLRTALVNYDEDEDVDLDENERRQREDKVLEGIEKRKEGKVIVSKYFDIKNNFIEKARKKRKALIRALNKK